MSQTQQCITDRNNLHSGRKALLKWQPEAIHIRLEGKCDNCKRSGGFVSYQLQKFIDQPLRDDGYENCGYYCVHCGWGNAGARKVEE